jgi:hypothetical protein
LRTSPPPYGTMDNEKRQTFQELSRRLDELRGYL